MSLPSPDQLLLLESALACDAAAATAWRTWRARHALDDVDSESARLLPLVFQSLRRIGVTDELTPRLAGIYKRSRLMNRLRFHAAAPVLAGLGEAGIPVLLLKGAALALRTYRDPGARSMSDVDLLVPPEHLRAAAAMIGAAGFRPERALTDGFIASHHSLGFRNAMGLALDLHWFASPLARWPGADDDLWSAAVPMTLDGVPTQTLCATDLLFHICAHGFASHEPHVRWLADAALLLRGEAIDWTRLVAMTRRRRCVLPLRVALQALSRQLDLPVPPETLAALAAMPVPWIERLEYHHQISARPFTFPKVLVRLWTRHQRSSHERGAKLVADFPRFLRRAYDVPTTWELPALGLRRALTRIRADLAVTRERR